MSTRSLSIAVCSLALLAGGCVSQGFYVQEGHTHTDFHDLAARANPTPVRIEPDYRQNGVPHPEGNAALQAEVARVLRASHVLVPQDSAPATLTVMLDDVYDAGRARSGGYLTGFTEGLVGFHINDDYVFTITFKDAGGQPRSGRYEHAIETVEGDQKPDSKWRAFETPNEAFAVVVKQATLDFLFDLQAVGDTDEPIMFVSPSDADHP
ncbi:MAG: hypothetical protein ISP90_09615 [Nevskia sp.]|nr:hypothetical protein [Nevskia sp.]